MELGARRAVSDSTRRLVGLDFEAPTSSFSLSRSRPYFLLKADKSMLVRERG